MSSRGWEVSAPLEVVWLAGHLLPVLLLLRGQNRIHVLHGLLPQLTELLICGRRIRLSVLLQAVQLLVILLGELLQPLSLLVGKIQLLLNLGIVKGVKTLELQGELIVA